MFDVSVFAGYVIRQWNFYHGVLFGLCPADCRRDPRRNTLDRPCPKLRRRAGTAPSRDTGAAAARFGGGRKRRDREDMPGDGVDAGGLTCMLWLPRASRSVSACAVRSGLVGARLRTWGMVVRSCAELAWWVRGGALVEWRRGAALAVSLERRPPSGPRANPLRFLLRVGRGGLRPARATAGPGRTLRPLSNVLAYVKRARHSARACPEAVRSGRAVELQRHSAGRLRRRATDAPDTESIRPGGMVTADVTAMWRAAPCQSSRALAQQRDKPAEGSGCARASVNAERP